MKRIDLGVVFLFILLVGGVFWAGRMFVGNLSYKEGVVFRAGSVEKFEYLSSQNSNECGLVAANLEAFEDGKRLQGSCCGAMSLHPYQEQVEGLKKYSNYSVVPEDPYDIDASLAKTLFGYQEEIQLTEDQQRIYDEAMEISHEGGPCCCRCWRWTAFEGQAKYLITKEGFNSQEIAELWDLEDGCGGGGHVTHEG